ncbi:hypothetical protein LF65_06065 [Clostridium beijerinckii]|uniref:Uncharacterized protein n=1 Tax=Clostridium beijerinckii TaxID=1520 RepID=A0A140DMA3_CLOBE|nr:hypothetical protein LF65_06065 [Clostridium beijerinckii]
MQERILKINEIYDFIEGIDVIFVKDKNNIVSYVSRIRVNVELEKHIDLLTEYIRMIIYL